MINVANSVVHKAQGRGCRTLLTLTVTISTTADGKSVTR